MKYILTGLVLTFLLFFALLANYLGAFREVVFSEESRPAFYVVYRQHIGPYHKVVPSIQEVEDFLRSQGAPCTRTFGEYLDDPKTNDEDRLRSHVGCLVDHEWTKLPPGFQSRKIEYPKYLVAVFKGSPAIGPFKVYPEAERRLKERPTPPLGPPLEIYEILDKDRNEMVTTYLFP